MTLAHVAVMAVLVATILYFPFGIGMILALRIAGIGVEPVLTFGGTLALLPGLIGWWLVFFAGALIYAASFFPWSDKVYGWPKKK